MLTEMHINTVEDIFINIISKQQLCILVLDSFQ